MALSSYRCRALVLLIAGLTVSCSTLRVADGYALPDKSIARQLLVPDGKVRIAFQPITRLFAVGVLGVPVVPTNVRSRDLTEFILSLELTLYAEHHFSFASGLCLGIEAASSLCSDKVLIRAAAGWQDDGSAHRDGLKRWHDLPQFYQSRKQYYDVIEARPGASTIDRMDLYEFYDYDAQRTPKWGYLKMEILYHFTCADQCPKQFTMDERGLLSLDGTPILSGAQEFHRARFYGYGAAEPVQ